MSLTAHQKTKKFDQIKSLFSNVLVCGPTYPSNDPDRAIEIISGVVDEHYTGKTKLMFIGASLGGYYAQYLGRKFNAKIVLINPALNPAETLSNYIGENANYYTKETYILTPKNIEDLSKYYI